MDKIREALVVETTHNFDGPGWNLVAQHGIACLKSLLS